MSEEQQYSFEATVENFEQFVLNNSTHVPVLVDFWAPWCGPCQNLMPLLVQLSEQYAGTFLLAKVNIDEQPALASQFAVRSVPTVKLFRHGKVVDEFMGALPESQLRAFLDKHVDKESDKQMPAILEAFANGEQEAALQQLRQLRELESENLELMLCESEFLRRMQRSPEALELLNGLPAKFATEAQVQAAKSRLQLDMAAQNAPDAETLLKQLADNPADHPSRLQLANRYSGEGKYEQALEQFMELLRRAPDFEDQAARKGMLMVFDLLGGQGELVSRYRRQMFTALH